VATWRTGWVSWGPRPRGREALPAIVGLAGGILAIIGLVSLDSLLATRTALKPNDVLGWAPASLAGALLLAWFFLPGRSRDAGFAAFTTVAALLPAVDLDSPWWAYVVAAGGSVPWALLRLAPATRVVTTMPVAVGLALALTSFLAGDAATTAVAIGLFATLSFLLWFQIPYASGWRRVPFLLHYGVAAVAVVSVVVAAIGLAVAGAFSMPDGAGDLGEGGIAGVLTALAWLGALLAYPFAVWRLWHSGRAQAICVPGVVDLPQPKIEGRQAASGP
jgi:hypothetical protein